MQGRAGEGEGGAEDQLWEGEDVPVQDCGEDDVILGGMQEAWDQMCRRGGK